MGVRIDIDNVTKTERNSIKIMCFDITNFSQTTQFVICCCVVFIFFLLYGYMQELIFTLKGFQPYGWYLTLVQFGYYTIFGLVEKYATKISARKVPLRTYCLLALLTLGTMGLSNASLGYLNYPTQVIFKCCKLLPVLLGSILIQGKRYGPLDFGAAICMCIGLTLFTLADSSISPNFNLTGVVMISLALLCDAAIGNVQEKSMKQYNASNAEIVLYSYSIGFFYIFVTMFLTGDFYRGVKFCAEHPKQTYGYALLFSLSGYLGIQVVLTLVNTCGALAAATVTTCRKAVTIIISFLFFSKPFTAQYLWSGLLVVLGIYVNIYNKRHPVAMRDLYQTIYNLLGYINRKVHSHKSQQYFQMDV